MAKSPSWDEFLQNLVESRLLPQEEINATVSVPPRVAESDGEAIARRMIASGKLTPYQAAAILQRNFNQLVIGNYLVLDRLGAGAMGTVYKALHRRMKRVVAIKVLSSAVAQTEKFVQRFQREVEAVARLSHPNIVMAYDADEAEVGHFLVMEFVNGRDLASEVQQRGPLPIPEVVDCIVQSARALDYAHRQGIIHRDVKPANLLRDVGGTVKVADLGLARFNDSLGRASEEAGSLTQAGTIMGTVDFMPPEQALGLTTIDNRADVYSLGCTLYYLLLGRAPYQGQTLMATLMQHREAPIPSSRAERAEVPAALDAIFQRMVAKKLEDRFGSMAEVVLALETMALVPGSPASSAMPMEAPAAFADLVSGRQDTSAAAGGMTVALTPAHTAATGLATVLLVEPSRSQAVIIRGYLQKLGILEVSTAPSGQKALEVAQAAPPGVVVSAMHLPDMTGVQLAQRMRAEVALSSTGFVLITSQGDSQEANLLDRASNTIRLPKPFDLDQLAGALAAASGGSGLAPLDGPRVLIVDDSPTARNHVRSVLAGLGLRHVVETVDGIEAMAALEKERFDLVVTDYNMPRLDGRQLIEFIRRRSTVPSVPVILVTTETDPARLEAVRRLGVSVICDKSFKPDVVRAVVQELGEAHVGTARSHQGIPDRES